MKKIKIAIIAHSCRTGGGLIATVNLLKALKNVVQDEQFLVVCSAGYGYEQIELPANSELYVYEGSHSPWARYWFEKAALPNIVERYKPNVIFGAGNTGLTRPCAPQALFIRQGCLLYNMTHRPDMSLWWHIRFAALKSQIKKSLPATSLVFCQTPIVKQRFCEKFHYPKNQIKILRFCSPIEATATPGSKVPSVFDESGDFYILLLTSYLPHRNPGVLMPLLQRYGPQIRSKHIKFITTIGAGDHPRASAFLKEISKHHLEDVIINVGHLSREDVSIYFSNSQALWLPTMVETLGLPYLEAMRLGVPILAPDIDFAKYVCGEAAIFYNPWDIESIFKNLILIREDFSLRQKLSERGKIELNDRSKFAENWETVAKDVIDGLRQLANQNQK